ncbi:MAG: tRNA(Ile)-lysidine synthase [Verrucomicrobia subdivision 3 bacterium]|nr:tRNA(Ile)-lysidine synthase [Limisphaerales bacterium]MCS1415340.1 tRNA(Ile)-lysidine synthase [Limisphaerales bacterium]
MGLIESVEATICRQQLLSDGDAVLVAVSGGVDSVVLLDLLGRLASKHGWKLTVGHCNHQLRGKASEGDERFVQEAAERMQRDFVCERVDVQAGGREKGISVEMAARDVRHRFLGRAAEERGIGKVALAHHSDDQAELFFLRILRGAGSAGLGGMKGIGRSPFVPSVALIRPLLEQSKGVLLAYAEERGLNFREDETNQSTDVLRNRVRHQLLPQLAKDYSPMVLENILRSMQVLADDHQFVEDRSRAWLEGEMAGGFPELPLALQREVLRLELLRLGIKPSFRLIEDLRVADVNLSVMAPGGRRLCRDAKGVLVDVVDEDFSFSDAETLVDLSIGDRAVSFSGLELWFALRAAGDGSLRKDSGAALESFDAGALGAAIRLRHWHPGDRFQPIGMSGSIKLQDWFVNEKVPVEERRRRVVGESQERGLFWVEGMRIGERFKVTSGAEGIVQMEWVRREQF